MPIPDFQTLMLPLLQVLGDGQEWVMRGVTETLADRFQLSEQERQVMLPSGQQALFANRVGWAKTHLKGAGLILNPSRGKVLLSDEGRAVLAQQPEVINCRYLRQYPSYLDLVGQGSRARDVQPETTGDVDGESGQTPLELMDESYDALRRATADELLVKLKECSPAFFEKVVVKLLQAMGYGGVAGEALVTGRSGDAGIDGIIKEDKLGLDVVCIQAKRWEGTVGRPVIQGFVGSMDFVRARKGVILTTSQFSREAIDFVDRIEGKKVVLINGPQLADLMIDHNVGVLPTKLYELKEVSNDFFDEDEG
jgi:restriction system protein